MTNLLVVVETAELDLEVDEADADAEEETDEEIVDPQRELHDLIDLLRGRPAERRDVLFRDHRIVKLVFLVVEFDDRARKLRAFFKTEARRQRTGCNVAHDDLERHDLNFADQLLAHVESLDEMRRYADLAEFHENVFGDAIVQNALAFDQRVLLRVEGGRVVFEMLNEGSGLRTLIEDLRLALVNAPTLVHSWTSEDQQLALTHCDIWIFSRVRTRTLTP